MLALRRRLRAIVVGGVAMALVTIGAGGTLAASTATTVWACYNAYGQVALASIPQCKLAGGGQLVQINAAGVPGPTGPTGSTGPTGPTGPTAATAAVVTRLDWDFAPADPRLWPGTHVFAGTPCPSGTAAISGWSAASGSGADLAFLALVGSGPTVTPPAPPTLWEVAYNLVGPPPGPVTFQVYTVCAP